MELTHLVELGIWLGKLSENNIAQSTLGIVGHTDCTDFALDFDPFVLFGVLSRCNSKS